MRTAYMLQHVVRVRGLGFRVIWVRVIRVRVRVRLGLG